MEDVTINTIIFIVVLIVPGVFFKRFYFRGQFTKQFTLGLFADRLITSIFWGLIVQLVTFWIFAKSLDVTYNNIKEPASAVYKKLAANSMPDLTTQGIFYLLGYLSSSLLVASLLGCIAHGFIRFFKIDSKFEVFRFANHWNYYFKGDVIHFGEFKDKKIGKVLSTTIDIILEDGSGGTKMFSGFITQYQISISTGGLESLYLTDAHRWSKTEKKFKPVPGDCLIIPYSKVVDMNIRYNIRKIENDFYKKIIKAVIALFSSISFLIIIIYPWFLHVSKWRIILGIILSLISWLFLITLLNQCFKVSDNNKNVLDVYAIGVTLLLLLLSAYFALWLFGYNLLFFI